MKIGVMSDLHLGLRQYGLEEREVDFYNQYNKAIDIFLEKNVDIVIIGGDIFDQPRPSPRALEVFSKGLKKLSDKSIQVLNIVGNHSMVLSNNFITADDFLKNVGIDNYHLLDLKNIYMGYGVIVSGLPFYHNFEIDYFYEDVAELNKAAKKASDKYINILVLHQAFQEFCGFAGEELSINDLEIDGFDLIICGHIHEKKIKELDNGTVFLQPGSLERSSVAEARDESNNGKGVFIIDTENEINGINISNSFVRIQSPRKFLIADMYMNETREVGDIKQEIFDNIVNLDVAPICFLTVHDTSNSFAQIMDLTKELKKECLTVRFSYFDESGQIDNPFKKGDDLPSAREALKIALNPLDKDEYRLGLDLYDNLKDGKDVTAILEDFLVKRQSKEVSYYTKDDLAEIEEYFKE